MQETTDHSFNHKNKSNHEIYQQARLSRDARFDGQFFIAVKTTGIYCRPICPAKSSLEKNVEYFDYAHLAAQAGYRPCLRCHPDSAPNSPLWNGVSTTLKRAKQFIDDGVLEDGSLTDLSDRLGISDRYLRQLFDQQLGISPKAYALFRQCEFAKNLLHQTSLSITQIAYASGFRSVRRFNDCLKKQFSLNPSGIRKNKRQTSKPLKLRLYYRPPYNWDHLQAFFSARLIEDLEWSEEHFYGRTFKWDKIVDGVLIECKGKFTAHHNVIKNRFDVELEIDNLLLLKPVINNIRRILDLDADSNTIEQCIISSGFTDVCKGMRLPGTWSVYEAGIRAILGQQISVVAARNLVKAVIENLGESEGEKLYFPTAKEMKNSDYDFIKMPGKRKETLTNLATHFTTVEYPDDADNWLSIKGIGPWTVDYAKMRGLSNPDIYLIGDLGVKKAMEKLGMKIKPEKAAPFRSYLTFQLWNQL